MARVAAALGVGLGIAGAAVEISGSIMFARGSHGESGYGTDCRKASCESLAAGSAHRTLVTGIVLLGIGAGALVVGGALMCVGFCGCALPCLRISARAAPPSGLVSPPPMPDDQTWAADVVLELAQRP